MPCTPPQRLPKSTRSWEVIAFQQGSCVTFVIGCVEVFQLPRLIGVNWPSKQCLGEKMILTLFYFTALNEMS
eukprot:5233654-Amphidinium_carterae.1